MLCRFGTTCCLYHPRYVPRKQEKCKILPAFQQSNEIYRFSCHGNSRYVGRTSQRLQDRIKQHIPKSIRKSHALKHAANQNVIVNIQPRYQTQSLSCDSTIGLHLLRNPICAQNYVDQQFSILTKGRSPFHLSVLKAIFIKTLNPILCRQKEFVYNLTLLPH